MENASKNIPDIIPEYLARRLKKKFVAFFKKDNTNTQNSIKTKIPNPKIGMISNTSSIFPIDKSIISSAHPKGQGASPERSPGRNALFVDFLFLQADRLSAHLQAVL